MAQTTCPRCGARDSFMKGYLPETCVCRVCQSQLDWREIPGCGPDCTAARAPGDRAGAAGESGGEGRDPDDPDDARGPHGERGAEGLAGGAAPGKSGDWDV